MTRGDNFDTTTYPLIINSSSLVAGSIYNNVYRYTFPAGSVQFKNSKLAITNVNIFYSWFNISAANDNNTFSFIFPNSGGSTTFNLTLPDGYYSVSDINSYIQQICIANTLYLVDSTGNNVYYLQLSENSSTYSVQFNAFLVPTSLPSGYTDPGFSFPLSSVTPQLIVNANNFQDTIGFLAGTYPAVASIIDYSVLSTFTPQVSTVQSVVLACSLLSNKYSNPNTILYTFTAAGTAFGDEIVSSPNEYYYVDIQDGNFASFDMIFLTQDFNPLPINDTNIIIQLLVQNPK